MITYLLLLCLASLAVIVVAMLRAPSDAPRISVAEKQGARKAFYERMWGADYGE